MPESNPQQPWPQHADTRAASSGAELSSPEPSSPESSSSESSSSESSNSGPSSPGPSSPESSNSGPSSPAQNALALLSELVAAVELTPLVAVRSFDRNGIVCFWNQTAARLYGVTAADAVGQVMTGLVSYGEREQDYLAIVSAVWHSAEALPSRDWKVSAADGRSLWIYSSMFPVYRAGRLEQVFCMDVDITERKREEDALDALMPFGGNFRQLFEKSADAILLIKNDSILEINPAATTLFRCGDRQRMLGQRLSDFSPLQQPSGLASALLDARMAEQAYQNGNCRYDWRYLTCQGELFWAEVLLTSVTLDHEYLFYAVIRDISLRKQIEHSLYLSAQVFENARDAILVTDTSQRIVAVNRAYTEITGFAAADMMAQPLHIYRGGVIDEHFYQQIWEDVAAFGHWQGEIDGRRKNGELYPASLSVTVIRDPLGHISNYMGILSDITDRKKSEEHTRHLAEHDFLTDLPNRVLLLDRLSLALVAARRKHTMLAILFLDLDHFKNINDTMGHHIGDLLLKEVARRLIKCVRGVDTVSRQGGDEFVIILADIGGIDQAAHIAASILQAVTQVYAIGEYELHVSTSIGVSIFPSDGDDIETLIKNADIAMYHAKENGRNGFQFFNADMNAQIVERVTFENGLREALANDEFILEYQPEIDIASGGMVGAEALIRWQHPQLGLLLPERFIAVAEESGLMIPIGNWVLKKACQQARRWHDAGYPLVVAVNLSVGQFTQKNLVQAVDEALRAAGLAPAFLELEITEAIVMKRGGNTVDTLAALRGLGVKLTIDDFGTGYSRLGLLRDYPIDKLKIDQSFMADITSNPADAAVITAIIAMARSLKMKVIAEGVETAGQLQFLRDEGCDEYQGFYASSAVLATELGKMLH